MCNSHEWSHIVWVRKAILVVAVGITFCFGKRYCGKLVQVAHGEVSGKFLASRIRYSSVLMIGLPKVFLNVCLRRFQKNLTWNMRWWINDCPCPSIWSWCNRGTQNQEIGRSKDGWTTKILALTDAGNLVRFHLLPDNRFDTIGAAPLIEDIHFGRVSLLIKSLMSIGLLRR